MLIIMAAKAGQKQSICAALSQRARRPRLVVKHLGCETEVPTWALKIFKYSKHAAAFVEPRLQRAGVGYFPASGSFVSCVCVCVCGRKLSVASAECQGCFWLVFGVVAAGLARGRSCYNSLSVCLLLVLWDHACQL